MRFQNCAGAAADEAAAVSASGLAEANVNPTTGLATDYLNSFNEAIMLLDMLSSAPDFRDEFLRWQTVSYREHFATSRHEALNTTIAAYESADPQARACLEALTGAMAAMLELTRAVLGNDPPPTEASSLAGEVAAALKLLVARAGAVISGETDPEDAAAPQAAVDDLMRA